jgi:hypothetical protein
MFHPIRVVVDPVMMMIMTRMMMIMLTNIVLGTVSNHDLSGLGGVQGERETQ